MRMRNMGDPIDRSALTGNLLAQYFLQIAKYILPFVTLPYLARVLGPDAYSIRAYALAVMTFVQIALDFGFNLSASKEMVIWLSEKVKVNKIIGSVFGAKFILSLLCLIVLLIIGIFIPLIKDNAIYMVLAFFATLLNSFLPDFVFMAYEKMQILTKRYVVSKVVGVVLIFLLVHDSGDLLLVPVADIVTSLIALAWSWVSLRRSFGLSVGKPSLYSVVQELRHSSLYFVSNAATAVYSSFTTIVIGVVSTDLAVVSSWSLAMTALQAVQSLYSPLSNALYPHMLKRQDLGLVKRLILISFPIVTIGTIGFCCGSSLIMQLLGGAEYLDYSYVISLVSPVLWFSLYGHLLGWPILGAYGKVKQISFSTASAALFSLLFILLFAASGMLTLVTASIIRVLTEAIMMLSRAWFARAVFQKKD